MAPQDEIKIEPLPIGAASGAAVSFPRDSERNARFRERFPKARWSSQTGSWLISGKTAAQRAALWAEEEAARGALEARLRLRAEIDRAWHEADPAVRAAREEKRRRREEEEALADAAEQVALDSRRYKPDDAMIERIVAWHMAIVEADKNRIGSAYMASAENLRKFLRRGVAPGASAPIGPDQDHFGANITATYLGDGRVLRVSKYGRIRGRNGRWQEPEADRSEIDAAADLMEKMLSCLAWNEFKPRSGFGTPKSSRR